MPGFDLVGCGRMMIELVMGGPRQGRWDVRQFCTLARCAQLERTSTVSTNSDGRATGMTYERARPSFEKTSGSTVKSVTRNGGQAVRCDVLQPVLQRRGRRPANAKARRDERGHHQRDPQSPGPRWGGVRLEPKWAVQEHEHTLRQRRADLRIHASAGRFAGGSLDRGSLRVISVEAAPARRATRRTPRMCHTAGPRTDRPETPGRSEAGIEATRSAVKRTRPSAPGWRSRRTRDLAGRHGRSRAAG